jgi:hypothetical protein
MRTLRVLTGDRYVIGVRCGPDLVRKLFQIVPATDGSLYVSFPYSPFERGRVGILTLPKGPDQWVLVEDFPLTTHHVKYAHHPRGLAHFSQSGRVKSTVRKFSVPFGEISGHIFTVSFQGIDRYKCVDFSSEGKRHRGIVAFPFQDNRAYKFVARIYSESELAKMTMGRGSALWLQTVTADGTVAPAITFEIKFRSPEGRRYLLLSFKTVEKIPPNEEECVLFLGGFDPPAIALDRSRDTRALMFLFPENDRSEDLLRRVGTVDLQ